NIGEHSSIWFNAVIRGDTEQITIGESTNIQDHCLVHADAGQPCILGNRVTLGHSAIVHGATIEDDVMIGIRATVLNGAKIGQGSLIAANALVPEKTIVPPHSVVMGVPGKIVRHTSDGDRERIHNAARHYVKAAIAYQQQIQPDPSKIRKA
ncbi:MAG: gamma carbonic anhydrase family protein, partial [Planctomycetota bacterium]|nr:gamma carbonic anhydrase family protein [Planctomycetota bacterium]